MKKIFKLTLVVVILMACGKDNPTEPEEKTPSEDSSFFFPLTVGNIWYYYENDRSDATQSIRVWDSVTLNDTTFILYGNKSYIADTLYQDKWGRVYRRFNGKNLLWLDFSAKDGGAYEYKLSEKLSYTVTVTRNQTIEYDGQTFQGCIQFDFDVPTITTDEESYILAPDVGIVKHTTAWMTKYLKSWELK